MGDKTKKNQKLTNALEDYLETVFELVRDNKLARVKDIAKARKVRSASVIPAMRRLKELGLIEYVRREYIDLTPEGERAARRVYARHNLLARFFEDILGMPKSMSQDDACAMEHSLSDEGMDYLVKFFEYLHTCEDGKTFLKNYKHCSLIHEGVPECKMDCTARRLANRGKEKTEMSLDEITPGKKGRVSRISGTGAIRQRLLDMGIMPDVLIEMARISPSGDPLWVRFQGTQLSLRKKEAQTVVVTLE